MTQVIEKDEAVRVAAIERENLVQWQRIVAVYDLRDHTANYNLVKEWLKGNITLERFRSAVLVSPNHGGLSLDLADSKARLIADIANELDPKGARLSHQDINNLYARRAKGERVVIDSLLLGKSSNLDALITKLQFETKAQLRARLAEIQYRRGAQGKSASENLADLATQRQAEQSKNPFYPFPHMPQALADGTAVDSKYIRSLPVYEIKRLRRQYSPEQVDARLRGEA